MIDLKEAVQAKLRGKRREWKKIARALQGEGYSYSFICGLGSGRYKHDPSYRKLLRLSDYLDTMTAS